MSVNFLFLVSSVAVFCVAALGGRVAARFEILCRSRERKLELLSVGVMHSSADVGWSDAIAHRLHPWD